MTPNLTANRGYTYRDLPALLSLVDGDEKHALSATSTLDVLWVLYDQILRVDPSFADDPERDRFLLSKGHGPAAFYSVLAAKGFIPTTTLATMGSFDSPLGFHPDRMRVPGVEISSGSLGHGLPLAVGVALGLRVQGLAGPRVVCLLGDAELDEGTNHEAIAYAGAVGLDSLTAVVVDNSSSTHGWTGGIARHVEVAGWAGATVDGHDHAALAAALADARDGRPTCVVAVVEPKG